MHPRPALEFDQAGFIEASTPELRGFLEQFVNLQMFHQFLDHRYELMSKPSANATEPISVFNIDSYTGVCPMGVLGPDLRAFVHIAFDLLPWFAAL